MNLTSENIAYVTASATIDSVRFAGPLKAAAEYYDITSPRRLAGFLGQTAYESGHFRHTEELLGYSAKRLTEVWPDRFPTLEKARPYAFNPKALANFVYANRMGNGNEASGDGWCYRGRGLIQITGAEMYKKVEAALGMSITGDNSFRLSLPDGASWSACWYFYTYRCNYYADEWDIEGMTRAINGGTNGLEERIDLCEFTLASIRELGSMIFDD